MVGWRGRRGGEAVGLFKSRAGTYFVSGTELFAKVLIILFYLVSAADLPASRPPDGGQRRAGEKSKIL